MQNILQLFTDLKKMDPVMARALANIRAGRGTADDANVLARGMYTDTMVPKMGNKLAYNDFLQRHGNSGTHVHVDMNDFGQINKKHGEKVGDVAIKTFGNHASELSRKYGGKAFRNGGDEFKFHFARPEQAHGFSRELRQRLEGLPKVAGTHNYAASIGIGHNPDHAEEALLEAKKQLGPTDASGKRQNLHTYGNAPTVIHSKSHEPTPAGWKPMKGKPPAPSTPNLNGPGLTFHNPLAKGSPAEVLRPIPAPDHPIFSGGRMGIMSADDPMHPQAVQVPGGNAALETELKRRGLRYDKITGKYQEEGPKENSFIIHDVDAPTMMDLGRRYGQDSVVHTHAGSHKLIYTNGDKAGMYHPGEGHMIHATEPRMFYSTLVHNGKPTHFTLNLDFEHMHPMPGVSPHKLPTHEK
jgi:GGDEF domain-containing protein